MPDDLLAVFERVFAHQRWELAFPLNDAERALVELAPFRHSPNGWKGFALSIHDAVLDGYRSGQMSFKRMMQIVRGCSLGCEESDRVEILALTADRALRITPKRRNSSMPPYPDWHRQAAVDLVRYLEYDIWINPSVAKTPAKTDIESFPASGRLFGTDACWHH